MSISSPASQDEFAMQKSPPRPCLVLRVGITGHRPNKLTPEMSARIEAGLRKIFSGIDEIAKEIVKLDSAFYSKEPSIVRLISGFAEGADQIAVMACPSDWQVEALLPFPKDEYLKDFAKSAAHNGQDVRSAFLESLKRASTITQLAPNHLRNREDCYADVGSYLIRQIDLLIAVWDGKSAKVGGTGALARRAFEGGIPVVWISTAEDRIARLVSFDESGQPNAADVDCMDGPLQAALKPIFGAVTDDHGLGRRSVGARLQNFLTEKWRRRCYFTAYDFLKRAANARMPRVAIPLPSFEDRSREWAEFIAAAPDVENLRNKLKSVLLPRFLWADALAVYYSELYRSAYVSAYFFAATAVFIALSGLLVDPASESLQIKAVLVFIELIIIGFVIGIITVGRYKLWHERWLDYRALAESLRHSRFLAFVSEYGRIRDVGPVEDKRGSSWILWYIRATMREIGLPTETLSGTYQWRILNAALKHEIDEQISYHRGNEQSARRIDHAIHLLGTGCFIITFGILAYFLICYLLEYKFGNLSDLIQHHPQTWMGTSILILKPWITFWTAGLPALGAALAGIRVQGEFRLSAETSAHTANALSGLKKDFVKTMSREIDLHETIEMLISAARAMSEDTASWQELYGRKRLVLPA